MKRFLQILLGVTLLLGSSVYAETATQQDQNAGFLDFATTTFSLPVASAVYILGTAPGNVASWSANYPNSSFCVLPDRCKGFIMLATGSNVIIGHPNDVATGAYPVGYPVTAGTPFQWASRNPDQKRLMFKVLNTGTSTGYLMFSGWGE